MKEYNFEEDSIRIFKAETMKEIEGKIDEIFEKEKLPKNKKSGILIKPNFNNDLIAMTGNSTDLRVIVGVLKALKKRGYEDITIADGPNCGIDHIGIDVFSRLCIDKIAEKFNVKLINLNKDKSKKVKLVKGEAEIAKTCLDADYIINIPKLKTHVEAGITVSCKNYIGCFKGKEKRKIHNNLTKNIIRINEIINTDLIIVDGLIGMEGRGPGDGIPKKVGILISGHDPYLMDLACSKFMGLNWKEIPFLKIIGRKISKKDLEKIGKLKIIKKFKKGKKSLFDKILLNNFFINIRFSPIFEKLFNRGVIPWILFKLGVKQDKYIFKDRKIKRFYLKNKNRKKELKKCLETYCPLNSKKFGDECIKCMYCFWQRPDIIGFDGELNDFKMQLERFR